MEIIAERICTNVFEVKIKRKGIFKKTKRNGMILTNGQGFMFAFYYFILNNKKYIILFDNYR